jgi:hypothetical protein
VSTTTVGGYAFDPDDGTDRAVLADLLEDLGEPAGLADAMRAVARDGLVVREGRRSAGALRTRDWHPEVARRLLAYCPTRASDCSDTPGVYGCVTAEGAWTAAELEDGSPAAQARRMAAEIVRRLKAGARGGDPAAAAEAVGLLAPGLLGEARAAQGRLYGV